MKAPQECETIDEVRAAIDALDREILTTLARRFDYVKAVTRFKKTEEDVYASERFQAVLAQRRIWAEEQGLSPDVIEDVYRRLIGYFIDEELKSLNLPRSGRE